MVNFRRVRHVIEKMYDGRATITEYRKRRDDDTKTTHTEPFVAYESLPCRLSRENAYVAAVSQGGQAAAVTQTVKLFTLPTVSILPGSKITVRQDGKTEEFRYSGYAAHYSTHQEIVLELWNGEKA